MPRPVIGLSCYLEPARWGAWELPAALLPQWYVDLFVDAGADVVLIPPQDGPAIVDRLDALVLVGGADVDSSRYGEDPHATADQPRTARDASEIALYRRAREIGMPVLGVCRGLQIMAVAHGGNLIQHLPDVDDAAVHRERPGEFVEHGARFADGSLAASLLGPQTVVNSSHHQAVGSAGDLAITGWADDGTVEVCEDPTTDFCIGVQWHPEHPDRRWADRPLIDGFLAAADRFQKVRYSGVT